ncbi:MAG: hypothetical protein NZ108_02385, partial [Bacteroidia bacterium]|nr:hypothetical protein [Bacteroidia bacterium]
MNPIDLFHQSRKNALAPEEAKWMLEQLRKYPYFALLHAINAKDTARKGSPDAAEISSLAALYSVDRQRFADYMQDKLQVNFLKDVQSRDNQEAQKKNLGEVPQTPVFKLPEQKQNSIDIPVPTVETISTNPVDDQTRQDITLESAFLPPIQPKSYQPVNSEVHYNWRLHTLVQLRTGMYIHLVENLNRQLKEWLKGIPKQEEEVDIELCIKEPSSEANKKKEQEPIKREIEPVKREIEPAKKEKEENLPPSDKNKQQSSLLISPENIRISTESMKRFTEPVFEKRRIRTDVRDLIDQELIEQSIQKRKKTIPPIVSPVQQETVEQVTSSNVSHQDTVPVSTFPERPSEQLPLETTIPIKPVKPEISNLETTQSISESSSKETSSLIMNPEMNLQPEEKPNPETRQTFRLDRFVEPQFDERKQFQTLPDFPDEFVQAKSIQDFVQQDFSVSTNQSTELTESGPKKIESSKEEQTSKRITSESMKRFKEPQFESKSRILTEMDEEEFKRRISPDIEPEIVAAILQDTNEPGLVIKEVDVAEPEFIIVPDTGQLIPREELIAGISTESFTRFVMPIFDERRIFTPERFYIKIQTEQGEIIHRYLNEPFIVLYDYNNRRVEVSMTAEQAFRFLREKPKLIPLPPELAQIQKANELPPRERIKKAPEYVIIETESKIYPDKKTELLESTSIQEPAMVDSINLSVEQPFSILESEPKPIEPIVESSVE